VRRPLCSVDGLFAAIYRSTNASTMGSLVSQARTAGLVVRLWALDAVVDDLKDVTIGVGPGEKFPLLNRLLADVSRPAACLVVADDDVVLPGSSLIDFLYIARRCCFGIAQPAHLPSSLISHQITRRRRWSIARLTTFVEIGPLFSVSAHWRNRVLPFPSDVGMGWGLEAAWMRLQAEGCRLGIVDATPMQHVNPPNVSYVSPEDEFRSQQALRELGVRRWRDTQRTLDVWRPWHGEPAWCSDADLH